MAALRRHQRQPHPQPQQRGRSSSSTGQRRREDPSLYAYPQAQADKVAYWGCALPCCGALVLSALHHHQHHQQQRRQQRQWREKRANDDGGLQSQQQQQAAALSLLRLGVLSEDEYGVVTAASAAAAAVASAAATGAAGDKGIALTALNITGPPCTEDGEASPLPPTVCSSPFSSVCSSLGSCSGPASAPTEGDEDEEQEESKEEEEGQQQQQQQYQEAEAEAEVEVDPITLEPLGPASGTFTLCLPQQRGLVVRYNLETLARYLVASGRFVEPTSRSPLGHAEVEAMARQLQGPGMGLRALGEELLSAFAAGEEKLAAARERMDLLEGLDRCVGEIVTEMLRLIESSSSSTARRAQGQGHVQQPQPPPPPGGHAQECEEEVRLCMLLPHLDHFLAQLVQTDARYALQCLDQYIRLVRGPPNCPTQDQGGRGLLKASLRLLSEKERALRAQLQQRQEGAGGQWGREEPDGGGGGGGGGLVGLAARALAAVWNARW